MRISIQLWNHFLWGLFKISKSQTPCSKTELRLVCSRSDTYRSIILTPNSPSSSSLCPRSLIAQGVKNRTFMNLHGLMLGSSFRGSLVALFNLARVFVSRFAIVHVWDFSRSYLQKQLLNGGLLETALLASGFFLCVSHKVCQTLCLSSRPSPAWSQSRPTPHGHCLRKKEVFPQLDVGVAEQRQHQRRRRRAGEMRLICLCHNSAGLLSSEGVREEGRRNAALQVTNSKESSSRDFSLILKMWNPRAQHMW